LEGMKMGIRPLHLLVNDSHRIIVVIAVTYQGMPNPRMVSVRKIRPLRSVER
jgi:hypothetical protein